MWPVFKVYERPHKENSKNNKQKPLDDGTNGKSYTRAKSTVITKRKQKSTNAMLEQEN